MRKEISFREDVVRDAAAQLGLPEEKVDHVFTFCLKYIKELSKRPDVVSIRLPFFGTLYAKRQDMEETINFKKYPLPPMQKIRYKQVIKMNNSALESFNLHWRIPKIKNRFLNMGMDLEELENFQNKLAKDEKP